MNSLDGAFHHHGHEVDREADLGSVRRGDHQAHLRRTERIVDAGNNRVVAIVYMAARGKRSGAAVEFRFGTVHTLKDGQVVDGCNYPKPADALAAAGAAE
jgi:ketosteroid isomerase-like protein